jgi:protein-S-isoprenylcysteine O-methyltransferase Ste14
MASYEENSLIDILGNNYFEYQKRVPKWFPRPRKIKK